VQISARSPSAPLPPGPDLTVDLAADGTVRISWGEPDWFGPGRPGRTPLAGGPAEPVLVDTDLGPATEVVVADDGAVRCALRALPERAMVVFRTEALVDLRGLATGAYDQPSVAWPTFTPAERLDDGAPEGLRALAYQHCEFALPAVVGPELDGFFLLPHRPPTGWPLLLGAPDGRTLLVAPLDAFHDVTVGLNGGTVRCGWSGDLDRVPAGFATDLAVIAGNGPRDCLDRWAAILLERAGTVRPGRWADALGRRPSYWTDNGAAYWYRTEPGHDVAGSIVAAVDGIRSDGIELGAVQLDSWFYPHVDLRPFDTDEWVVPPSAMVAWEERADVLPSGIADLRDRLGGPPLVAHIRHLSSTAPMAAEVPVHVDGPYAVPADGRGYERWLDQCVAWGVETFEHDWLVEVFFGVRGLREEPGRARAWQESIDRAARERGLTLQWCMGTPADLAQTTTLTQVTSVRTCGDHGYIATAGQLWAWFCVTNALAGALGLHPFKDVFRTDPEVAGATGEAEALLSALSTGPVGLGDRVGRFDAALGRATCRADGILVKPHTPIAATGTSMLANAAFTPAVLVASCRSEHAAGHWTYLVALHPHPTTDPLTGSVDLADLGLDRPRGDVVLWDWSAHTAERVGPDHRFDVTLDREGHRFWVAAPVLTGDVAVIGDVDRFVTAGDARIEVAAPDAEGRILITVKGAGEGVTVTGWAAAAPDVAGEHVVGDGSAFDAVPGIWTVTVAVPARGWTTVSVAP
jgi:hypothetical protein